MFTKNRLRIVSILVLAGMLLFNACQSAPALTPEVIEVVKTVEVTKIVQGEAVTEYIEVTAAPPPDAPENPKPKGEVLIWGWPAADRAFESIIDGFNEEYPDVHVTWEMIPGQASGTRDALSTALAAGEGAPDISMIEINDVDRFVMQGGLVDLLQSPYNAGKYQEAFVSYKWEQALTPDGRLLAFPWDIGPASMFYRKDVFEKAGLPTDPDSVAELLSNWEAYIETGKQVTQAVPDVFWMDNADRIAYIYYAHKNFFDENYDVAINNPKTLQVLNYAKTVRDLGMDAKSTFWTEEWYAMLANGQIATTISGCWFGGFLKSWIDPDGAGLWGVIPIPEDPQQNWGGSFLAITEQSKNKEAAWAFIEYAMADPDAQNRMFVTVDYFPALKSAWENPLYEEPDFYFGGEKTRELWATIAGSPGKIITTPMDSAAESAFLSEVTAMLDQGLDTQVTLERIEQAILERTAQDRELLMEMLNK